MKKTEMRNPKSTHIDKMDTASMLSLINEENFYAVRAVEDALSAIGPAVDAIAEKMTLGGRLIYIGCGTSGRLAVQDAAECPPTYGVSYDTVRAIIAGGASAMTRASEGAEDNGEMGISDFLALSPTSLDTLVGISASGGAPYVNCALEKAKELGCITVGITSNEDSILARISDFPIVTDTGAEVVTGSTRMKAGTAQKLVLNMISTAVMIKTGKVYENLMINLRPTNVKLRHRMITIVMDILGVNEDEAEHLLEKSSWNIPQAAEAKKAEAKK